jgi:single-strand DNA-binding protein
LPGAFRPTIFPFSLNGMTLAAERIKRLSKGPNHGDDKGEEPRERSTGPGDDADIPFEL